MTENKIKKRKAIVILLFFSVILNATFVVYLSLKYINKSNDLENQKLIIREEKSAKYDKYFEARNQLFGVLPNDSSEIVFVGNSITEGFPLQEMFGSLKIKNRGVGGNEVLDVLNRLNEITASNPSKIFLQIGINDFLNGRTVDSTFLDFTKLISKMKVDSSATNIYVQSLFPTSLKQKHLIPKIEAYNKKLNSFCHQNGITYIDLYPHFSTPLGLDSALTYDGVHLNGSGYLKWKGLIEKHIKE